jgi:hypothetical protein
MFVWGTANPVGESDEAYNGLYLTAHDIDRVVNDNSLVGLPVKIEHVGGAVGNVVLAWKNQEKLDILIDVDEKNMQGDVVSRFVRNNICNDFSLGYNVGLKFSESLQLYTPTEKIFNEVSIVRRGARSDCHIHGFSCEDKTVKPDAKKRKL